MSGKQLAALRRLAERDPAEPLAAVAEGIGVRPETLRRWLGSAGFREALLSMVRDDILAALPLAKDVLITKAVEGQDKESLKLILTISGLLEAAKADTPPAMDTGEERSLSDDELLERVRRLRAATDGSPGPAEEAAS